MWWRSPKRRLDSHCSPYRLVLGVTLRCVTEVVIMFLNKQIGAEIARCLYCLWHNLVGMSELMDCSLELFWVSRKYLIIVWDMCLKERAYCCMSAMFFLGRGWLFVECTPTTLGSTCMSSSPSDMSAKLCFKSVYWSVIRVRIKLPAQQANELLYGLLLALEANDIVLPKNVNESTATRRGGGRERAKERGRARADRWREWQEEAGREAERDRERENLLLH